MFDDGLTFIFCLQHHHNLFSFFAGVKSAFTVTKPVEGSNKYTARFTKAITNVGGHYSTSTGIFTCKYPGIYVFALHILRESGNSLSYASCSIRKNRSQVAEAFSNPEGNSEIGWDSSSTSVVVHLARGDEVDVYCGSSFISINARHTSFSGFLNQAD